NLGIGCVAKGGKSAAHHGEKMEIKQEACPDQECKKCIEICPVNALAKDEAGFIIRDESKCRRCRFCHSTCKHGMFITDSHIGADQFVAQMVDNALGVVKAMGKDNIFYLNLAIDIVPQCDCSGVSDVPFVPDIGILASMDPVAVDQACVDKVHESLASPYSKAWELELGKGSEKLSYIYGNKGDGPVRTWEVQLSIAEEMGLGSREYDLVDLDS
ncbi:DUF362 domain-containing protein, partial [Candidatus Bathyarchaeota archaeon]|nr:DUF362 domain-containing protein [Candidatus Bathyarchaeota archaeon]